MTTSPGLELAIRTGVAALLATGAAFAANEGNAKRSPAAERAYRVATAGDPHYENRALWPEHMGETAYYREKWPKARVLVWAHPGKSDRSVDPTQPRNWLENGKPATKPFDEETDLVFPDSDSRYMARVKKQTLACRHLTVGRNAFVSLQKLTVHGNVWIKEGGDIGWLEEFSGDEHTFARNDNSKPGSFRIANKLTLTKSPDASAEIVGNFQTGDDLNLISGVFIVGPDAMFQPGDRSIQGIYPKATLVLLSGAKLHKRGNQHYNCEIVVAGKLLAGLPDRPLTRDCFLGISYKNKKDRPGVRGGPHHYGLVVLKEGTLRIHSADPTKARLVLGWHKQERQSGVGGDPSGAPRKIDVVFMGDVEIDGIEFNDLHKGGILLPDPASKANWKNVFYGEDNLGKPEDLYRKYDGPAEFNMRN